MKIPNHIPARKLAPGKSQSTLAWLIYDILQVKPALPKASVLALNNGTYTPRIYRGLLKQAKDLVRYYSTKDSVDEAIKLILNRVSTIADEGYIPPPARDLKHYDDHITERIMEELPTTFTELSAAIPNITRSKLRRHVKALASNGLIEETVTGFGKSKRTEITLPGQSPVEFTITAIADTMDKYINQDWSAENKPTATERAIIKHFKLEMMDDYQPASFVIHLEDPPMPLEVKAELRARHGLSYCQDNFNIFI